MTKRRLRRLSLPAATIAAIAIIALYRYLTMPNYTPADRPNDIPIRSIVIHCTECDYNEALRLLTTRTDASAHYLIRAADGHVEGIVPDRHIAWHCGNRAINAESIGIEIEGYVSNHDRQGQKFPFSDAAYHSAARLVRDLCRRYGIPADHVETRATPSTLTGASPGHIFGHDQVPDPEDAALAGGRNHHLDPGATWDWDRFMKLVNDPNA